MTKRVCWQCDYCGKVLLKKSGMKVHEKKCFRNPESRACITCKHPYYGPKFPQINDRCCEKGHDLTIKLWRDCPDHCPGNGFEIFDKGYSDNVPEVEFE